MPAKKIRSNGPRITSNVDAFVRKSTLTFFVTIVDTPWQVSMIFFLLGSFIFLFC